MSVGGSTYSGCPRQDNGGPNDGDRDNNDPDDGGPNDGCYDDVDHDDGYY